VRACKLVATLVLLGLCSAGSQAWADGDKESKKKRIEDYEEIHVPAKRFDLILKRFPGGIFLRPVEWHRLLEKAAAWQPKVKKGTPRAPLPYVVQDCNYKGTLHKKQRSMTFIADASVRLLDSGWHKIPMPKAGLVLGTVTVDGKPGQLIPGRSGTLLLLKGPGQNAVRFEFSVKLGRKRDGPGARMAFGLLPATAGSIDFDLDGRMAVTTSPQSSYTRFLSEGAFEQTRVCLAHAGGSSVEVDFEPEKIKVHKNPYVVAQKLTRFDVGQTVVILYGQVDLRISRHELDAVTLDLPRGFTMRTLSAEASPSWIQHGSTVKINLAEARSEKYRLSFTAERAVKPGEIKLEPVRVSSAAREIGLVAFSRRQDVKIQVLAEQGLDRRDEEVMQRVRSGRYDRVYAETPSPFLLTLQTRSVIPKVNLNLSALYELEDYELKSRVVYRYNVTEGSIFLVRALVPRDHEVDGVQVWVSNQSNPNYDMRVRKVDGTHEVAVEFEQGILAGQQVRVVVNVVRSIPEGLKTMTTVPIPVFGGSPAQSIDGYLGFAITGEYSLRSEQIQGLTAVPAKEMVRVGIDHTNLVLGYRIDHAEHGGRLSIKHRKTRLSVKSLHSHTVADQVVSTRAHLAFDAKGAPTREVILFLPKGKGANAYIDGPSMKERGVVEGESPSPELERFRVRFLQPVEGKFELFIDFDTPIATFKTVGAASTSVTVPRIHVADVERESGIVAIYSSDSTQLTAKVTGLRPIEVTAVPKHPRVPTIGRPLLAFNYVRPEFNLELVVRRYEDGEVLTALCEFIDIHSSVGVDGVIRHTARFGLKNLSHQFLGLALPAKSRLWSVIVDGEGVKPALDTSGSHIIPLPLRGGQSQNGRMNLTVVYDQKVSDLHSGKNARLVAPALVIPSAKGNEEVPVVATSWSLAVPDDNRIISVKGNLQGLPKQVDRILMVHLRNEASWAWSHYDVMTLLFWLVGFIIGFKVLYSLILKRLYNFAKSDTKRFVVVFVVLALFTGVGLGILALFPIASKSMAPTGHYESARVQNSADAGRGRYRSKDVADEKRAVSPNLPLSLSVGTAAYAPTIAKAPDDLESDLKKKTHRRGQKHWVGKEDKQLRRYAEPKNQRSDRKPAPAKKKPSAVKPQKPRFGRLPVISKPNPMPKGGYAPAEEKRALGPPKTDPEPELEAMDEESPDDIAEDGKEVAEVILPGDYDSSADPRKIAAGPGNDYRKRIIAEGKISGGRDMSKLLDYDDGTRDGLRSLVFQMPAIGRVYSLSRRGGEAWIDFELLNEGNYRKLGLLSVIAGFLCALIAPSRWKRFTYLGLLLFVIGSGTALAAAFQSATLVAASNGAIAGFGLAGVVHIFFYLMKRLAEARNRSHAARPQVRVIASMLLVIGLFGLSGAAEAQGKDSKEAVRVYVPYNPKTMKTQHRVFVPSELFKKMMSRAYPKVQAAPKVSLPAPFSLSEVTYTGNMSGSRLDLDIQFSLHVYGTWVKVPLKLQGLAVRFDEPNALTIKGPDDTKSPRLLQEKGQMSLIVEKPGVYQLNIRAVVEKHRSSFVFQPIPVGAAEFKLTTKDMKNRILFRLNAGGQEEKIVEGQRHIRAFIGHEKSLRIVVTPPEVTSLTGSSDASAKNITLFALDNGVIRVYSHITLNVVGSGWEGFRFRIPKGMSIVQVVGTGLREWRTLKDKDSKGKGQLLELFLRQARSGSIEFNIEAEVLLANGVKSTKLPEIVSLGVKREHGIVALAPSPGMKIRSETSGTFFQISPRQATGVARLLSKVPGRTIDRAYSYGSRPTGLTIDFIEERTVMKARTRVLGVISKEDYRWRAQIDFTVTKGLAHELAFRIPTGMNCEKVLVQDKTVLDWRLEIIEKESYVVCNLRQGLTGRFSARLWLRRAVRGDRYQLYTPDIRPAILQRNPKLHFINPRSEEGAIVLAVKDGLKLQPLGKLKGWEPVDINQERHWLPLQDRQESPRLAYTMKSAVRHGQIEVSKLAPQIRGDFTMHAQVFHEVVRYRVHMAFEIERSGARFFSFLLPTRFGDRVEINAPNRRELTVQDVTLGDKTFKEYRVELQSAVSGLYEMTFVIEDLAGKNGEIRFPELVITNVERSRGYILVEKDAQVYDELVLEGSRDVGKIDAANVPALPPERTPFSFIAAYKVQQPKSGVTDWEIVYRLKKVRMGQGPEAVIDWVRLTSVIHKDGRIQSKGKYRVRNRRLQFLALKMPAGAKVWSLRVAGKAKRVYENSDGHLLLPLPKRVEADLSFDVEVVYETQLGKTLTFMSDIRPRAPTVATLGLRPKQSYWSVYVPEEFDYFNIKSNMKPSFEAEQQTSIVEKAVQEIALLAEVAQKDGQSAQIFDDNFDTAVGLIAKVLSKAQLKQGYAFEQMKSGELNQKEVQDVNSNGIRLKKLEEQWGHLNRRVQKQRRSRAGERRKGRPQNRSQRGQKVKLGGNQYMQSFSNDWALNPALLTKKKAKWEGIANESDTQMENLAIFALDNQKVQKQIQLGENFQGKGNSTNRLKLQQAYQQELQRGEEIPQQVQANVQQNKSFKFRPNGGGFRDDVNKNELSKYPALDPSSDVLQAELGRLSALGKKDGKAIHGKTLKLGLLSMHVDIDIVGTAYHFTMNQGEMDLSLTAMPKSVFKNIKDGLQILAFLSLLLLIPHFGAFRQGENLGLGKSALSVVFLGVLAWTISFGWFAALTVLVSVLGYEVKSRKAAN
jgi:hypothetical protein